MIEQSKYMASGKSIPAGKASAVVPADTDLADFTRGLYIGTGGDVVVVMGAQQDAPPVTFIGVPSGTLLPIRVAQVRAATTASDIVALY